MLRRFFSGTEDAVAPDPLTASQRLLALKTDAERGMLVLTQLNASLPGDVRGYVVTGQALGNYKFLCVYGYDPSLQNLSPQHGPWRNSGPRVVGNLIQEMFTPNDKDHRAYLGNYGFREAQATLVVPVAAEDRELGVLVLHRYTPHAFTQEELKLAAQWGRLLGGVLGMSSDLYKVRRSLVEFTSAFVSAFEAQDFSQLGHGKRVAAYALSMGRALEFNRDGLADLYFASVLHDIGKLGSGQDLSTEDHEHPLRGANLVASAPLLERAAEGIRSHHERWDGTGFPRGLSGESIDILGRIVAVADMFDYLSSERGRALPMREVERELKERAGSELDPDLVNLFVNILRQGKSTADLGSLDHEDLPF